MKEGGRVFYLCVVEGKLVLNIIWIFKGKNFIDELFFVI